MTKLHPLMAAILLLGAVSLFAGIGGASSDTSAKAQTMQDAPMVTTTEMSDGMEMSAAHAHPLREVSPDLPVPTVTHLVFPDAIDGYNVQILVANFDFTPAAINRDVVDNTGHAHLYVNGQKIARVYSTWFHLPSSLFQPGENVVSVSLNANDHSEWAVDGSSIASAVRVVRPAS